MRLSNCTLKLVAGAAALITSMAVPAADPMALPARLIVRFEAAPADSAIAGQAPADAVQARVDALAARAGRPLQYLRQLATGATLIDAGSDLDAAALERFAARLNAVRPAGVTYIEPDRRLYADLTPNDPMLTSLWGLAGPAQSNGLAGVNAYTAWDRVDGSGVTVAVIDTGYRAHADLAGQVVAQYDFISDPASANDGNGRDGDALDPGDFRVAGSCGSSGSSSSSWHGTHVAGTIAARGNNGSGVVGVAYGAKLVIARVLGRCGGSTSDIADAIVWSAGGTVAGVPANPQPAQVLNMSLGGQYPCSASPTTQAAIDSARARGATVVVAAGNSNLDAAGFSPASCNGVISVAAIGDGGSRAPYSNYGTGVDLAAPGGDMSRGSAAGILSTYNGGATTPGSDSYAYLQGTSMASPHVAGVVALLYAARPTITPDEVEAVLKANVRPFPGSCSGCGSGLVDVTRALAAITPGPGSLSFSASAYAMPENGGIGTISVQRGGGDSGAISVNYATSNGTATAGSDYGAASGTLNWADGDSAAKTFTVAAIDDALAEGNESINLTLSAPGGGASLGTQRTAVLNILDNDNAPGSIAFTAANVSVAEAAGAVTVSVARTGGSYGAASVSYATANSSAASGSDYTASSGTLSWASGDSVVKTIRVPVLNDTLAEASESFQIRLSAASGASLGSVSSSTVTIVDDDSPSPNGTLQFSAGAQTVAENAGSATITVSRSLGAVGAVSVNYASSNGSAVAGSDYTATSGTLRWADGDSTAKTFTVPITDDAVAEAGETLTLSLSGATGGAVLGTTKTQTLTIADNDGLPGVLALSAATASVPEAGGSVTLTVTRSGGSTGAASVQYATFNSSAVAGSDFAATSGTLSWASGDGSAKTIRVPIYNDAVADANETFQVRLSNAAGASLGSITQTVVSIADDDTASANGSLVFSAASQSVAENAGTATITVRRTQSFVGAVSVDYASSNGSAIAGSDYGAVSGTLRWADGDSSSRTFTVPITDDAVAEASETLTLNLANVTGGAAIGSPRTLTLSITDNDGLPGVLALAAASYSVSEAGGAVSVQVNRSGGATGAVSVAYATANGSALAGSDYGAVGGTLVWANGDSSPKTIRIPILDDRLRESAETIQVRLSNPITGSLGAIASATVTIVDND
ncbi:MAG: S8 family serine peptidase [Gammaproteobacteria bacterium]|nr:S8 family serine peptidase [Gammaproteobacteria bacterium]